MAAATSARVGEATAATTESASRVAAGSVGFDVPLPGAFDQPWHRDFPSPPESYEQRTLTSLAFNMTTVDVAEDMGPFEVAPGTQWEDGRTWDHGMFPSKSEADRYASIAQRKAPRDG